MHLDYFETFTVTLIFFSVFLGGIVKGSVGIGMSMFSVPIIAFILPPTKAMMLLCVPVVTTNFIQMSIKKGITDPLEPITFPYLTTENLVLELL